MQRHSLPAPFALSLACGVLAASSTQAQVVINEVDYDQDGTDASEFVELYNSGDDAVDLTGYTLVFRNGANGTDYESFDLSGSTLAAGGFLVVCGDPASGNVSNCDFDAGKATNLIQNGAPDAMALTFDGAIVDALSYEGSVAGFVEGSGSGLEDDPASSQSLSRCPDGEDTDSNADDFVAAVPTPGTANACGGSDPDPDPDLTLGACGEPATPIHAVQGVGASSPLAGQRVVIEGVVVAEFLNEGLRGFFVQEEDADADGDPATSEGVFVYAPGLTVALSQGDGVRVAGQVTEYNGLTELTNVEALACATSGTASAAALTFPVDAVEDLEAFEGMRVQVTHPLTVTESYTLGRYGELSLSVDGRLYQPTHVAEPGAAALAVADLNARSRILLDDGDTVQNPNPIPYLGADGTRRLGDVVPALRGVLHYAFGSYRIQPSEEVVFEAANPRPSSPEDVGGDVKVASFNVLNFFVTLDEADNVCGPSALECRGADNAEEYARQLQKTLNALERLDADVVALNEIENDEGAAAQALVDGLNARLGEGTYAAIDTGAIGTDAIKLAFLYKPAIVAPLGVHAILDSSVDARFVDTKNRPALAQTFIAVATGERVTVVNNHLKSKGSACDDVGDPNLDDGQGNCNGTRTQAVLALIDWLAGDPTGSGSDRFLVMGDLNAYAMEDPIDALKAAGYEALVETFVGPEAYSYVFSGEFGYLDHALASPALAPRVTGVSEWHINADEPIVLDYNTEFKTQDPFDPSDAYRASDHDPLLVGLDMTPSVPRCDGAEATIYVKDGRVVGGPMDGWPYRGVLLGTAGDDVLVASADADLVMAFAGDDIVCGGDGDDQLVGQRGDDALFGEGGDDRLFGGLGDDRLDGGDETDLCLGQAGRADVLNQCERGRD